MERNQALPGAVKVYSLIFSILYLIKKLELVQEVLRLLRNLWVRYVYLTNQSKTEFGEPKLPKWGKN